MKLPLIGLALILVASLGSAKAQLITNGNFGTGDFTSWTVPPDSPQYSPYTTFTVSNAYVGPNGLYPGTSDSVWFGTPGTAFDYISQSFTSVVGVTYQLSFALETYGPSSGSPMNDPGSPANEFLANIGGTLNATSSLPNTAGGYSNYITGGNTDDVNNTSSDSWSLVTRDWQATSTTTEVIFAGLNNNSDGTDYLADVSVEVVPEPSTYAMLLGGLGLLAFWRLRTRPSLV
jgi:hypothetical protein